MDGPNREEELQQENVWRSVVAPLKAESDDLLAYSHSLREDSQALIKRAKEVRARSKVARARSNQQNVPATEDWLISD